MATFSEGETVPVVREGVIMEVIREMMEGRQALIRLVGIGFS